MRLFVAVGLPANVRQAASELIGKLKLMQLRASFVAPSAMHVSLLFLGNAPESELEPIKTKVNKVNVAGFSSKMADCGVFPNWNYIKVAWWGLSGDGWAKLYEGVSKALQKKSGFRFIPHLTLARIKAIADKPAFIKKFKTLKPEHFEFKIEEFKLIQSELTPAGPIYTELASFRLF